MKADVIFAFWGFNESFEGYEGIEKFKAEMDKYLKDLKAAKYNGKSAPRIVLFSPIAQEKVPDPNFPDPTANNTNLQNYTAAMAEVAKANDVQFVDLYNPSLQLFKNAKQPLTHNGIHLTDGGIPGSRAGDLQGGLWREPAARGCDAGEDSRGRAGEE